MCVFVCLLKFHFCRKQMKFIMFERFEDRRERDREKKREINRENANISMEGENKKRESEKKTK